MMQPVSKLAAISIVVAVSGSTNADDAVFRAGAAVVDISPTELPVRRNGGFLEAIASRVIDPLFARALVMDDGEERIAMVIVDSCMLPRRLCDEAKAMATDETGIARDRMLIASTHTHSAPSAMSYCLGSRVDEKYATWLPPRLAKAIIDADARRRPAEIGYTIADAPEHTNCRRWIRRPDRVDTDPFGERTVRAMMHPGHRNPDFIGPSGPVDTGLSLVSVRGVDGRPIAVLGNYSMHYFGVGGGLSPDFCGLFARRIAARFAPGHDDFVGLLSQGTSGDLHWMDYSRPRRSVGIGEYTEGLVDLALQSLKTIRYRRRAPIRMKERRLQLGRRLPDAARLEWARRTLPDRSKRPQDRPQVYAEQAFFIDENPTEEIVLQALRVGGLGMTAIPCEVYGLTGLELKARSPLQPTFNLELANGAAGYIPPPEQHSLGGYTTWPARTAGLEVAAEPKILETVLGLLEDVSGETRREPPIAHGVYAATILREKPLAYFRLEGFRGPLLLDSSGNGRHATSTMRVAFHLRGPGSRAFSLQRVNRCVHLAGGHVVAKGLSASGDRSLEMWFWNGLPGNAREVPGTLFRHGGDELRIERGGDSRSGRLAFGDHRGATPIAPKTWNHVVFARASGRSIVYLNGRVEIEDASPRPRQSPSVLTIGAGEDPSSSFEGKIDEVSFFGRALTPSDVARHHAISGIEAPKPPPSPSGFLEKPSEAADLERTSAALLESRPRAYWSFVGPRGARDASGNGHEVRLEEGAGPRRPGSQDASFSGGRMLTTIDQPGDRYSVEMWFFNHLSNTARPVTGYFFSRGVVDAAGAPGEHLGIGGTYSHSGRLIVFNGNARNEVLAGKTYIPPRTWNHVVLVRDGDQVRVHLNGRVEPEIAGKLVGTYPREGRASILIGGRNDGFANFRGALEQIAVYGRPLTSREARAHFLASGLESVDEPAAASLSRSPSSPPRSAEETLRATRVRRGFRLEIVAAEPLVVDPVAIDWDAAGRLWVVEMADYPYGMDGKGEAGGRVRFLEDGDGDGRYDRSTLFADGLSFPTGIMAWRRGVLVTAAPDILYLEDTDGDGSADRRDVLYTGFLPGNQQLRVNGPRWGLDNWIHCASGGHHAGYGKDRRVRSLRSGTETLLGSRDLRIRPDDGLLEPQSGPSQFGRVRDDWGNWFGVQNSRPLWHYVLADRYARRNPHVPAPDARSLIRGVSPTLYPAKTPQKRYHSFGDATRFTSGCGPSIYRDELLFARGEQTHGFTCDPFHGLVQHSVLTSDGASFEAVADTRSGEHDFFASTDRWCRPVMTRTGPDGALWIVDMYRYMIEHPDWLPAVGKEELRSFYRSGDDRGRIYRIVPAGAAARRAPVLARDAPGELVERLGDPAGPVRDLAHRLLVERKDPRLAAVLETMALDDRRPLARLHALSVLDGMDALTERVVLAKLDDEDPRIVRHALIVAEPFGGSVAVVSKAARLVSSDDGALRLQLAHTLGEWSGPRAGRALGYLAVRDHADSWVRAAILSSAVQHQVEIARVVARDSGGSLRELASPLLSLALRTDRVGVVRELLEPVVAAGPAGLGTWQLEALAHLLAAVDAAGTSLQELVTKDSTLGPLVDRVREVTEAAYGHLLSKERPEDLRIAAISLLGRSESSRDRDRRMLTDLLERASSSTEQVAAVSRLREIGGDARPLFTSWSSYVPDVRSAVVGAVLSRPGWTRALIDAVGSGAIPVSSLTPAERQRLVSLGDRGLAARARGVLAVEPSTDRAELVAALRPAIGLNGISSAGRAIFERRCGTCHELGGVGKAIGPDLRALTDRSGEALLEAIVRPNVAVEPRYLAYTAVLGSGEAVHGMVVAETANSLILQLADGMRRTLLRGDVASLESTEQSFMPEGLEADLTLRDMADLLAFLQRE